jgi:hypothetical protein
LRTPAVILSSPRSSDQAPTTGNEASTLALPKITDSRRTALLSGTSDRNPSESWTCSLGNWPCKICYDLHENEPCPQTVAQSLLATINVRCQQMCPEAWMKLGDFISSLSLRLFAPPMWELRGITLKTAADFLPIEWLILCFGQNGHTGGCQHGRCLSVSKPKAQRASRCLCQT